MIKNIWQRKTPILANFNPFTVSAKRKGKFIKINRNVCKVSLIKILSVDNPKPVTNS